MNSAARTRALFGCALITFVLGGTRPVPAQTPTAASPAVPTPYSWPSFHAGGASPTALTPLAPYTLGTLPVPDALFGMLQGTPTGLVTSGGSIYDAEIPSYLLGNYDPTLPPAASATVFPNHFVDDLFPPNGTSLNTLNVWNAPFPNLNQILSGQISTSGGVVTVDDQAATGFILNNGSVTPPYGSGAAPPADTFAWSAAPPPAPGPTPAPDNTATGGFYRRVPVAVDPVTGDPLSIATKVVAGAVVQKVPGDHFATAKWALTAPTAGSYSVSLNLPIPVDPNGTSTAKPENRISDAHYVVTDSTGKVLADTRISQTETNSPQFLAGPFPLTAGQTITVTLDNSTRTAVVGTATGITPVETAGQVAAHTYVLADSMNLVPSGGAGDVQSSPAVVNDTEYPEIADALYFGYKINTSTTPPTFDADVTTPYGNATIGTTPPTTSPASLAERRRIRQLVYFGRSESVLSQDATTGALTAQPVGAIYCVDGNTGGVVWRYQTGGEGLTSTSGYLATGLSGAVKSTTTTGTQPFQIGPTAYTDSSHTTVAEGDPTLDTTPGTFGTYTAFDSTATQFTPADTAKLRFALYATTATPIDATHVTYSGTFRIYPNGSTPDDPTTQTAGLQILEHGSFSITATFTDAYNATLSGTFVPDPGALQPTGWPYTVDFSEGAPPLTVNFNGQLSFDTSGNETLSNATLRAGYTTISSKQSGAVFSTPALARVHVIVGGTPTAPLYATKLVVVVADDLGYVYCLDAVGNRDGTSNNSALLIDTFLNQPQYAQQPVFGAPAPPAVNDPAYTSYYHVGTTNEYWIYRPDPAKPKYVTGANIGKVKTYDASSDLPTPGAFSLASPVIDVATRLDRDTTTPPAAVAATTGVAADGTHDVNSAFVYIGNSNGTLYKLEMLGTPLDTTLGDGTVAANPGDSFNASRDLRALATDPVTPTPRVEWWLPINDATTGTSAGADAITSAPALRVAQAKPGSTTIHTPTEIYFTASNDSLNAGRLYRVDETGPLDNTSTTGATAVPGSANYNLNAQALWSFPQGFALIKGVKKTVRPALGSIGGSPVLFTNPTGALTNVYIAANVRQEVGDTDRYNVGDAGRIWSVTTNGASNWAYPSANDPNIAANDFNAPGAPAQPSLPIGGFVNATPAIGIVQFPTIIEYGAGNTNNYAHSDANGDVRGRSVPMLYVGSRGSGDTDPRLYGIDLNGRNDSERTIYADQAVTTATTNADAVAHSGLISTGGFVSSPALSVNASTSGGNGGSLFITATDNTLYQFDATPQSNDTSGTSTAVGPDFGAYPVYTTAGPYSSPAIAAYSATDLNGTGYTGLPTAVDFVYVGDSTSGEMIGITPGTITNFGTDGGTYGIGGGGDLGGNSPPPHINLPQFPLYVYLFKDNVNAKAADMSKAEKIGGPIAAFEWGEPVYIRVANTVPPNNDDGTQQTAPAAIDALRVKVPGYVNIVLTNGSPVSIQISETNRLGLIDVNRGSDVGQVPATLLATPPGLNTTPPGNGFVADTTPGGQTTAADGSKSPFGLKANNGSFYDGAYTYAIGDGSARKNTPGSRRRIITATQTAQAYDVSVNPPKFISTVTLTATVRETGSGHTTLVGGVPTRSYLQKVDQPTFAILNPLALSASGLPISTLSSGGTGAPTALGYSLGPFGVANTASPGTNDLPAYANGNRVPTSVPLNGVLSGGTPAAQTTEPVITTTGMINHGLTGATADANGTGLVNVADRSALGVTGRSLKITMLSVPIQWNDNSADTGGQVNGSGAVINPLPWEDAPIASRAGTNHSLDYPDIVPGHVRQILQTDNNGTPTLTNSAGTPDPATGTTSATRAVNIDDHIKVQIAVPKFQPANTQLYETAAGSPAGTPLLGTPIAPRDTAPDNTMLNFPMGYTARMRVFVDSDHNRAYSSGEAYRDLTVYTGVPIDMGTQISNNTIDLGQLTQGHGVQTTNATLGTFTGPYDPYNGSFLTYFKPVTAFNTGNVNLLNVLFDQRIRQVTTSPATDVLSALPFASGPLDGNATLPAYDFAGITGATAAGPVQPYILRTSLDPNLYAVAGKDPRNPAIVAASGQYTGATFHKARPGDSGPTSLTVPDVPHDSNNTATLPTSVIPTAGSTSAPRLSLAVPIGTPVGTYSQNVRLFEGVDPGSFAGSDGFAGPKYGGLYGGRGAPASGALSTELTFVKSTPADTNTPTQPFSSAVVVKSTVTETRNTDGSSAGTVPHIDNGPAGALGTAPRADFGPAVFRNVFWNVGTPNVAGNGFGDIDLYWTTSRGYTGTATPAYNVLGGNLPFTVVGTGPKYGFFETASTNTWYQSIGGTTGLPFLNNTGLNTNVSVAQEQHVPSGNGFFSRGHAYLFVQNTAAVAGATGVPAYENRIYCLQINPATGHLLSTLPDLTSASAPAFGTDIRVASSDPAQAKFGVKGLKVPSGTSFTDPQGGGVAISRDLWAFWGSGARGRSSISYTSDTTEPGNGNVLNNWTPTASLPVPAGLSSVSDPSAVLVTAPDETTGNVGNPVNAIDVTYTGIGANGNSDLYVSRYRPYAVRNAAGTATAAVGLALSPLPAEMQSLQGDVQGLYWQARDVAWARDTTATTGLNVTVNGTSLLLPGRAAQYDQASGILVYAGINVGGIKTVYIDLTRGRVRFAPVGAVPVTAVVTATFAPQARRITTDALADSEPIAFLDEAYKPNEASFKTNLGRVQTNRAWYIWRKSAVGKTGAPTLFYKTQRLSVQLTDGAGLLGNPVSINLDVNGKPQVDVGLTGTNDLYARGGGGVVDIDWARGRLSFPLTGSGKALEGQTVTVDYDYTDNTGTTQTLSKRLTIHWLDEPRYNDATGQSTGTEAASTSESAVPLSSAVNEGTVCAFLDPMAYADVAAGAYDPLNGGLTAPTLDQPHKIWLYWSSTRNGTADIYSQAIEPRFSAKVTGSSVP